MRKRLLIALAVVIWSALAFTYGLGFERVYMWAHCAGWHMLNEPRLSIGNVAIDLPHDWCPVDEADDFVVAQVPPTGDQGTIVVLLTSSLGIFTDAVTRPESVEEILGYKVRTAREAREATLGGMNATKLVFEVEQADERIVAWIFPDESFLALSTDVTRESEILLDELIRNSVSLVSE